VLEGEEGENICHFVRKYYFLVFQNEAIEYLVFACCSDASLILLNGVSELHVKLEDG